MKLDFLQGIDAAIQQLEKNSPLFSKGAHIASLKKLKNECSEKSVKSEFKTLPQCICKHRLFRTTKNYKPAWKCAECGVILTKKIKL